MTHKSPCMQDMRIRISNHYIIKYQKNVSDITPIQRIYGRKYAFGKISMHNE